MKQKLLRKTSKMLAVVMLLSLLIPVLAHASTTIIHFGFNTILTGYVYTKDPSSVSVKLDVYGDGTTVTDVTYSNIYDLGYYDDNNTKYLSVSYRLNDITESTAKIIVNREGQEHTISEYFDLFYEDVSDTTVTLDVYRMTGQENYSSKDPSAFLQPGDELVRFTPVTSDADAIEIKLPKSVTEATYVDRNTFSAFFDIEVRDLNDNSIISPNRTKSTSSNATFILAFGNNLINGHEYSVNLSSEAAGNEIRLPSQGTYHANVSVGYTAGTDGPNGGWDHIVSLNTKHFHSIVIGTPPAEEPAAEEPAAEEPAAEEPAAEEPAAEEPVVDEKNQTVNEASLKNGKDGKVAVEIANGKKKVLLPAKAAEMVGENKLELSSEDFTVQIPTEVLTELQDLVSEADLADAEISFTFDKVVEEDAQELLVKSNGKSKAKVTKAGDVFDFILSIVKKDGTVIKLTDFSKSITLKLNINEDANQDLLGVYYISDDGSLEYVGGKIVDGKLVATVDHFSKYAVLEYDKDFSDVSADFWASSVIKAMAAKHIINGISDTEFAPNRAVSRAEFAAYIVRALDLQSSSAVQFNDVASDAWYANDVSAAHEAGIVNGRSDNEFAPEETITRQEMVAMIVRAYEVKTGTTYETSQAINESVFNDLNEISTWAHAYVNAGYELGLILGKGNHEYAPQESSSRAESAQIVLRLLNK